MVDPPQISLQVVEAVVGGQDTDHGALLLQLGELAYPLQVRRALDLQVPLGRTAEHQRQYDLGDQHGLQRSPTEAKTRFTTALPP